MQECSDTHALSHRCVDSQAKLNQSKSCTAMTPCLSLGLQTNIPGLLHTPKSSRSKPSLQVAWEMATGFPSLCSSLEWNPLTSHNHSPQGIMANQEVGRGQGRKVGGRMVGRNYVQKPLSAESDDGTNSTWIETIPVKQFARAAVTHYADKSWIWKKS